MERHVRRTDGNETAGAFPFVYMIKCHDETQNIMPCCLPGTGVDGLHVEVIQDTNGWTTIYWWNQIDEDKQMHIIVTNVTTGTQNQFESQPGVTLFYLPMQLTNGEQYTVTVRGPTTHEEGEVTFHAGNVNFKCCVAVEQNFRVCTCVRAIMRAID